MVTSDLLYLPQSIFIADQLEQSWSESLFEFLNVSRNSKPSLKTLYSQIHTEDLGEVKKMYQHLRYWRKGRSAQLTFRVKCNEKGYKWVTNSILAQESIKEEVIISSKFFDTKVVKRGLMSLHQIEKQLENANPLETDFDIQYNPDLVDKVTQLTRIGWFEYYISDSRTVYSSSIKPMVGLSDQDKFTAEYFKSIVEPESREKALLQALDARPSNPFLNQDIKVRVNGELKWFNIQLEFSFVQTVITRVFGVVQDVTELRETQDKLERAQEISNTGWFEYDIIDHSRSRYSDTWLHIHDFESNDKPTWDEYLEKLHPLDQEKTDPSLHNFIETTGPNWNKLEFRVVDKQGDIRYISNSSRVLVENDVPIKVFGVSRDVTDMKLAQNALYKSERLHRLLSETSRDIIILVSGKVGETRITYISDSVKGLLGYEVSEMLGIKTISLIHEEDLQHYLGQYANQLINPNTSAKFNLRLKHKIGHYVWMEVIANSFQMGKEYLIRLSARDITERRNFEEQLILSNNDLDALIRATDNLIFVIDSDCRFERVIGTEERFHMPTKDFIGKKVADVWTDPNGMEMSQMVERSLSEHISESFDCLHINRKGEIEWLMVTTHPYQGYDNKNRVSVVIEEVTQQKKFEQELQKTLEMERELSKMRSNFVAMASHQFRTPLTVIKSNMQLLEAVEIEHPILDRISARLVREVDRLVDLMEDILLIGKAQTNNTRVQLTTFDLESLIEDILNDIDQIADEGRILRVSKIGDSVDFNGDYDLLRHAIINIVTNAFKYSKGKPNPELIIDYSQEDSIHIRIRDYGIGIPNEDHDRIFKDFYRGNNVRDIPGTGLGMSITQEFLKLNKASIDVESELGLGSTFLVKLPKSH